MAIFQEFALNVVLAETDAKAIKLFERAETIKDDSQNSELVVHRFTLANGASDEAVPLGKLTTGKAIAAFVDRQATLKLDNQATVIGKTTDTGGFFALSDTSFSDVKMSNASGEDINVSMVIAGA